MGLYDIHSFFSILVVVRMPETLVHRQRFRWNLLKVGRRDILEPKAYPAAIVMMLTVFSFGTILTLIPDMSKHLGIMNKGMFLLLTH